MADIRRAPPSPLVAPHRRSSGLALVGSRRRTNEDLMIERPSGYVKHSY